MPMAPVGLNFFSYHFILLYDPAVSCRLSTARTGFGECVSACVRIAWSWSQPMHVGITTKHIKSIKKWVASQTISIDCVF